MSIIDKAQERVDLARGLQATHDLSDRRAWQLSGAPHTLTLFLERKENGDHEGARRVLASLDGWDR